jgi:hypothetical protein
MLVSFCILLLASWRGHLSTSRLPTSIFCRRDFLILPFLSQEHLIYAGEHLILLLAKLEKTPWLLKAANIYSSQEGLSNLSILVTGTTYLCW